MLHHPPCAQPWGPNGTNGNLSVGSIVVNSNRTITDVGQLAKKILDAISDGLLPRLKCRGY
jgi:hypothetical protein